MDLRVFQMTRRTASHVVRAVRTNKLPTLQKYVNQVAVSGNIVQFGPHLTAVSEVPILRTRAESDTPLGARF
ncbi:hypothetical protein Pmani_000417 [Petrolisthes manimaculis]|uniref:Uncharacterized protein n=1 Tax=Petrolisthes manimaculis TaxID=1843537 RepID=A0AAE1QP88_9EUCA|nr:hypothetical protein Pmani_000417 [Petrolisthes manimaculis]